MGGKIYMENLFLNTSTMPLVDYAGYGDSTADDFSEQYRLRSHYTMIYVTGGALAIKEGGSLVSAAEGTVVFLKSNTDYILSTESRRKLSFLYINYFMHDFETKPDRITVGKTAGSSHPGPADVQSVYILPAVTKDITGSVLDKKIHDYIEYFNSSVRTTDLDLNIKFYDIMSECIKYNQTLHNTHRKLSEEIISYLNEHDTEQLNTSDMEKRFYLTYKYMGTAFKKETGETILSYHTRLRMNYAKRLITTTSHSIDEISRMLGYTDALYFSRVFKKYYGSSPQNFRSSETDITR